MGGLFTFAATSIFCLVACPVHHAGRKTPNPSCSSTHAVPLYQYAYTTPASAPMPVFRPGEPASSRSPLIATDQPNKSDAAPAGGAMDCSSTQPPSVSNR